MTFANPAEINQQIQTALGAEIIARIAAEAEVAACRAHIEKLVSEIEELKGGRNGNRRTDD